MKKESRKRIKALENIYLEVSEWRDEDRIEDTKILVQVAGNIISEMRRESIDPVDEYIFRDFKTDWNYFTNGVLKIMSDEELKKIFN